LRRRRDARLADETERMGEPAQARLGPNALRHERKLSREDQSQAYGKDELTARFI
jgi:hypothetical protein